MAKGTIKRLIRDRGFGFVKIEQGGDLLPSQRASRNGL